MELNKWRNLSGLLKIADDLKITGTGQVITKFLPGPKQTNNQNKTKQNKNTLDFLSGLTPHFPTTYP